MNRLSQLISRYRSKHLLITVALILLGLNMVRLATDHYEKQREEVSSRIALLDQYQVATRRLAGLRRSIPLLEKQKIQLESFLFNGETEDKITSVMQIKLQDLISKAGLEIESVRPLREASKGSGYGEIPIKVRLSGALNQFVDFLAGFYRSKQLFKIESFTLKPYKQKDLKLFIEFKGYYKLQTSEPKPDAKKA